MRAALPLLFVPLALVVALPQCAGCSEECSNLQQGAQGCPCQTDQDCTTVGAVLLCVEGTCTQGEPPDITGSVDCTSDTDCDQSEACAVDGTCQPAPRCQRLEPAGGVLLTRARDTAGCTVDGDCAIGTCAAGQCQAVTSTASITAATVAAAPAADCGMGINVVNPPMSATGFISRDSVLGGDAACEGAWFAPYRAGFLRCGGQLVALGADGVVTCIGADCGAGGCLALGDGDIGVCLP